MLKLYGGPFIEALHRMSGMSQMLTLHNQAKPLKLTRDDFLAFKSQAMLIHKTCTELGLPISGSSAKRLTQVLDRVVVPPAGNPGTTVIVSIQVPEHMLIHGFAAEISNRLRDELEGRLLLVISPQHAPLFEQPNPLFGAEVEAAFPEASEDISEAGKCLALGRGTAAVFHLGRAMETAARIVAAKLEATVTDEHGRGLGWGVIAENMKPKIDALPRGSDEQIKWYRVQAYLQVVNRAWRVPTAHPKHTYTPEEAKAVFDAAKSFMRELAPFA